MKKKIAIFVTVFCLAGWVRVTQAEAPLTLAAKYKMPDSVRGGFDHPSVDLPGNRLFLPAERAHEVLVFNLRTGQFIRSIPGIEIPHAIFTREDLNRIYVTDGGAGEVRIYDGKTYRLLKAVKLKVDSDSIGYDPATHDLYVVNGGGHAHETYSMLSAVNTTSGKKVADIKIDGDTLEAMAIERSGPRLYVNNPAKNEVDVINRQTRAQVAHWPVTLCQKNVAMALDESTHRLFSGCRSGAIVVIDTQTGKELQTLPIGKGVDDLIFDPATKRIYASCGAGGGATYVYREEDPDHYKSLGQVPSGPGGKNEVLVPKLGRLFVTIPPHGTTPGEVYVYQVH